MIYGYYDLIRQAGFGIQNQLGPNFSLDFAAFYIHPNSAIRSTLLNLEYYYYKGAGISLSPKLHLGIRGLYIATTLSLEYLEYEKKQVFYNKWLADPDQRRRYHNLETCYAWGSTSAFTLGSKFPVYKLNVEPFFSLGLTLAKLTRTTHSSSLPDNENRKYPYQVNSVRPYISINFGFKIGFSFKKNIKDKRIDSKFDSVYLPRHSALMKYMETIDFKRLAEPKPLRKVNFKIKKADKTFLKLYKKNYHDTTALYHAIENYYHEIDILIQQGKK